MEARSCGAKTIIDSSQASVMEDKLPTISLTGFLFGNVNTFTGNLENEEIFGEASYEIIQQLDKIGLSSGLKRELALDAAYEHEVCPISKKIKVSEDNLESNDLDAADLSDVDEYNYDSELPIMESRPKGLKIHVNDNDWIDNDYDYCLEQFETHQQ